METVLDIARRFPGRLVLAEADGTLYAGRHTAIHRSTDAGASWQFVTRAPAPGLHRVAEVSRLTTRLLRHEIRALAHHPNGALLAATRQGVFRAAPGERAMSSVAIDAGALPATAPMRIASGAPGSLVWGEYLGVIQPGRPIRIFASGDGGAHFEVVHEFAPGRVGHVHNVVWDEGRGHYWVLAGDHGPQPGIGILSGDFRNFEWLASGNQEVRVVEIFDFGDRLVYGTDTEVQQNAVVSLDKDSGRFERGQELPGSCIYAARFGGLLALSTSVEPSPINRSPWCELWLSRDGDRWTRAYRASKDGWNGKYFQFGSIVLPAGGTDREVIAFSGQAVRELDGVGVVASLTEQVPL